MHRFEKVNSTLYRYRGVEVILQFDGHQGASMLARIEDASGYRAQFYSHSPNFEKVKRVTIDKVDAFLDKRSSDTG